jgi:hypothetical protein
MDRLRRARGCYRSCAGSQIGAAVILGLTTSGAYGCASGGAPEAPVANCQLDAECDSMAGAQDGPLNGRDAVDDSPVLDAEARRDATPLGGACKSDADCDTGLGCRFLVSAGCTASATCVQIPSGPNGCANVTFYCSCDGGLLTTSTCPDGLEPSWEGYAPGPVFPVGPVADITECQSEASGE